VNYCYYCGASAHKIRTYDCVRMYVCYRCISARAKQKASEARKQHREGEKIRQRLIHKYGKVCQECGTEPTEIHAHHKKRLMDGGTNAEDNMILLCPDCHKAAHENGTRW
jgi:5-methylcytosine-specific restriction endonuclease McrA